MTKEEIDNRAEEIEALKRDAISLCPKESAEKVKELLTSMMDKLASLATDMAVTTTSTMFIQRIKDIAEESKAKVEAND